MDTNAGPNARNPDTMNKKHQFEETLDTLMKNYARTGSKMAPTAADELKDPGEDGRIQHRTIPPDHEIEEEEEIIEEYAMK